MLVVHAQQAADAKAYDQPSSSACEMASAKRVEWWRLRRVEELRGSARNRSVDARSRVERSGCGRRSTRQRHLARQGRDKAAAGVVTGTTQIICTVNGLQLLAAGACDCLRHLLQRAYRVPCKVRSLCCKRKPLKSINPQAHARRSTGQSTIRTDQQSLPVPSEVGW